MLLRFNNYAKNNQLNNIYTIALRFVIVIEALFAGTDAQDEYDLPRQLSKEVYEARIRVHRAEYISEGDFNSGSCGLCTWHKHPEYVAAKNIRSASVCLKRYCFARAVAKYHAIIMLT